MTAMKPALSHHPIDYAHSDLKVRFDNGIPLSADQHNFILWHEKTLSSHGHDPMLRYYLKSHHQKQAEGHSFLLPHEKLNREDIQALKRRLQLLLQDKKDKLQFKMQPEQFLQLRAMTANELILYHGNQYLTGAPFYPGGLPHTLYFQWGNLFGVAKYVVLAEEKALKSNVLIHFETMHERALDQCVHDYELRLSLTPSPNNTPKNVPPKAEHTPTYHSTFTIPKLTLSRSSEKKED